MANISEGVILFYKLHLASTVSNQRDKNDNIFDILVVSKLKSLSWLAHFVLYRIPTVPPRSSAGSSLLTSLPAKAAMPARLPDEWTERFTRDGLQRGDVCQFPLLHVCGRFADRDLIHA